MRGSMSKVSIYGKKKMYNIKGSRKAFRKVAHRSQHGLSDMVSLGILTADCFFRGSRLDADWHIGVRL